MNRKLLILSASILCTSSFACGNELFSSMHHDIAADNVEPWMKKGVLECNFAQVEDLGNPMWDPATRIPKDPSFDHVTVTVFDNADYYAISIEYEKPYPDAPHVLCHMNKISQSLLYVEYTSESSGNLEPQKRTYTQYSQVKQDQVRRIDTWSFSLSEVFAKTQE